MNRFTLPTVMVAALALAMQGCSGSSGVRSSDEPLVDQILASGKINVASFDDPPLSTVDPNSGELVGVIPDILRDVLDRSGMEDVEMVPVVMPFTSVIPALESTRVDVVGDVLAVTPEREAVVDFLDPFMINPEVAVVAKGNPKGVHEWTDMKGLRCGSWEGSVWAEWCAELGNTDTKIYPSFHELFQDIAAGRVDGGFVDRLTVVGVTTANPGLKVEPADPYENRTDDGNPVSIAVREDADDLRALLSNALTDMQHDGTLEDIFREYEIDTATLINQ